MTTSRFVPRGLTAATLILGAAICNVSVATGALRHTIVYYGKAPDAATRQVIADRYDMGLTGDPGTDAVAIKALNPDFQWFTYNSATDNYVTGNEDQEHVALTAFAAARGFDIEDAYLHYWDDTQLNLGGEVVTIPGWGGGSATDPAQARMPVYYKDLSRRLVNFSTPRRPADPEGVHDPVQPWKGRSRDQPLSRRLVHGQLVGELYNTGRPRLRRATCARPPATRCRVRRRSRTGTGPRTSGRS